MLHVSGQDLLQYLEFHHFKSCRWNRLSGRVLTANISQLNTGQGSQSALAYSITMKTCIVHKHDLPVFLPPTQLKMLDSALAQI